MAFFPILFLLVVTSTELVKERYVKESKKLVWGERGGYTSVEWAGG